LDNGGSIVIDYRVSFNNGTGTAFFTLDSNIVSLPYIAKPLTVGVTYIFKVQSRNIYGYSAFSDGVSILAAQIPEKPATPITLFQRLTVNVSWSAPFN
jgi:hypothetical protein